MLDHLTHVWAVYAIVVFFAVFYLWQERLRKRERAGFERWWVNYRAKERADMIALAQQVKFEREDNETDDQYFRRFERWYRSQLQLV